ncbi:replication protein B [Mute swan feces associated circular virus 8]|nr:replication protein B [Mute swan feces associated circular virus 8]
MSSTSPTLGVPSPPTVSNILSSAAKSAIPAPPIFKALPSSPALFDSRTSEPLSPLEAILKQRVVPTNKRRPIVKRMAILKNTEALFRNKENATTLNPSSSGSWTNLTNQQLLLSPSSSQGSISSMDESWSGSTLSIPSISGSVGSFDLGNDHWKPTSWPTQMTAASTSSSTPKVGKAKRGLSVIGCPKIATSPKSCPSVKETTWPMSSTSLSDTSSLTFPDLAVNFSSTPSWKSSKTESSSLPSTGLEPSS